MEADYAVLYRLVAATGAGGAVTSVLTAAAEGAWVDQRRLCWSTRRHLNFVKEQDVAARRAIIAQQEAGEAPAATEGVPRVLSKLVSLPRSALLPCAEPHAPLRLALVAQQLSL